MSDRPSPELFSRTAVVVAASLGVLLIVGVIVVGKLLGSGDPSPVAAPVASTGTPRTGPVALVPVEAPAAAGAECTTITTTVPTALTSNGTTLRRLELAQPAPKATVAWGTASGDPIVLRCGLGHPPELTPTAQLREVSGVKWLPVTGDGASTWYLVDRAVYVALTLPSDLGTGPLQEVSEAVAGALPARPVTVGPSPGR